MARQVLPRHGGAVRHRWCTSVVHVLPGLQDAAHTALRVHWPQAFNLRTRDAIP